MQERRVLEFDLPGAMAGGQSELFHQPVIGLHGEATTGGTIGFEALLRRRHPVKGLIPPERFIPLAEEIGVIIPTGEGILRTACRAATHWPEGMKVSVNLSAVQFKSDHLVLP